LAATACGDNGGKKAATTTATTAAAGATSGSTTSAAPKVLKPVPGFDGTTIKLGQITPLTGRVAVIGMPLTAGNKAWFDHVNELGGIGGKYKIQLVAQDSKYDPPTGVQAYSSMKNDVVMFAQILGTPVVNAILPQLKSDKIVAQPASLDSFWVREQQLLPVGAPYQIEAINALDYWWNKGGGQGKTVCSMIQDDPYGDAGQEGVTFAADKLGFKLAVTAKFKATDTDYTAPVNQLKSANCQGVFLVGTAANFSGVMAKAAELKFAPQWLGQSPNWLGLFAKTGLAPYLQANYWAISEGAPWADTSAPGMAEFMAIHDKFAASTAPGDQYFGFGYIAAQAVTKVLEEAVKRGDLSRQGIIDAMNAITQFDFGGLSGTYKWGAPADRIPPSDSSIYKIDPTAIDGRTPIVSGYIASFASEFKFK
jgi:ABC-type branched-subunit amino acid transport system substrate-binding protein